VLPPVYSQGSQLGHLGDELVGGQRSQASDAGQELVPTGECGIGSGKGRYLGVERRDISLDMFKPLCRHWRLSKAMVRFFSRYLSAVRSRTKPSRALMSSAIWACCAVRAGLIGSRRVAAIRASSIASMRSVLAGVPVASAKRLARSGFNLTQEQSARDGPCRRHCCAEDQHRQFQRGQNTPLSSSPIR
jgi:hypothetical protein